MMWIHNGVTVVVFVVVSIAACNANSTVVDACSDITVSGIQYQTSRGGGYTLLATSEWCDLAYAAYSQDDGSNFLFYIDVSSWQGWIIGSSKCQNLAGIVADYAAASDPTDIPSSVDWYELKDGNWLRSTGITVECDNGMVLSIWAVIGIVFGVIAFFAIILGIAVCCLQKKSNKPNSSHSSRRRINVATVCPSTTYNNPAYNGLAPTTWSSNPIQDTRYVRNNQPPTSYDYGAATSRINNNHNTAHNRNTVSTPLGPPPVYQAATQQQQPISGGVTNTGASAGPPPTYTSSSDVTPTAYNVSDRHAAFSPPPQYYE